MSADHIDCSDCTEPINVDARRCPHCQSVQMHHKSTIAVGVLAGFLALPFSLAAAPNLTIHGVPSGLGAGLFFGLHIGIVIAPLVFWATAYAFYRQRQAKLA